jgi:hypothetical protein
VGENREVPGEQALRLVRKVVVTYRLEDDPKGADYTFTLEHEGAGAVVDALVWSEPLMKKLAYLEPDGACTPVRSEPGKGWKYTTSGSTSARTSQSAKTAQSATTTRSAKTSKSAMALTSAAGDTGNCVWFHAHTCTWEEFCSYEVG